VATAATRRIRARNLKIAHVHLRHLSPFPRNLGDVLRSYNTVLVPELNLGQLSRLLRAEYLVDAQSYNRVAGVPLRAAELEAHILELMNA
jgi:2-oxoglutarate ferredoxin oxidoreductase subunit alpha